MTPNRLAIEVVFDRAFLASISNLVDVTLMGLVIRGGGLLGIECKFQIMVPAINFTLAGGQQIFFGQT